MTGVYIDIIFRRLLPIWCSFDSRTVNILLFMTIKNFIMDIILSPNTRCRLAVVGAWSLRWFGERFRRRFFGLRRPGTIGGVELEENGLDKLRHLCVDVDQVNFAQAEV